MLADIASEVRDARLNAGLSQQVLGQRLGWSADKVWQVENERLPSLSITDACLIGAALGLDLSTRLYPNGPPIRDAAQSRRLRALLSHVAAPLIFRTDVALPATEHRRDARAWDAIIYG
jgi:transcriptional regulator with XRE-family HTH domain